MARARPHRRGFRRSRKRQLIIVLVVGALVLARIWWGPTPERAPDVLSEKSYGVERVVDGDTLLLENGARVRLIGVDCPESVKPDHPVEAWGPEAAEFTRRFIGGREVRLEFDDERVDKYDRFLAYVYVDDRMLNDALVRAGLARATLHYNFSDAMKRRFREAQAEAREAGSGMWSEAGGR